MNAVVFPDQPSGPVIWAHANGKPAARAIVNLAGKVNESGLGADFLVTADAHDLPGLKVPDNVTLSALPSPRGRELKRFLTAWQPVMCLWLGAPVLPSPLKTAQAMNVPAVLLNAGEDIAEAQGGYFQRRVVQKTLSKFRVIFAENHISGGICLRHGAAEHAIQVTGKLAEGSMALPCNVDELDTLAASIVGRDVWFAAGVPMAELDTVLNAHEALRSANRRLLLILNTVHLESEETLAIELASKGWRVAMRDKGDDISDHTQIYLTCGNDEMGLWYRLAPVTYVGGTFSIEEDGADPLHAAALGSAILHGPRTSPHRGAFDQLLAQAPAASTQIVNAGSLARGVETLLLPHLAAEQANSAWEMVSRGAELTDQVIALIEEAIDVAEAPYA